MARTIGSSATRTRQRVLDAACELFREHGYTRTSLRDIAERLSMTKAALYYHFATKEDLLRAVLAPVAVQLAECVHIAETGEEPRRRLLRRIVDLFDDHQHILKGTLYDPGARQILLAEDDLFANVRALEHALASSTDPAELLMARCALGTIRGAIVSPQAIDAMALNRPPEPGTGPSLSEQDRELVTAAAWSVLNTTGSTGS